MTTTDPAVRAVFAELYAEAKALRGSQAAGALRVIRAVDPDHRDPGAPPRETDCVHGVPVHGGVVCTACNAASLAKHPAELCTFVNPTTRRRSVLCRTCRRHPSFHRHTGESA